MSAVFQATLTPMLVMFSCIVIGFVLNKCRLLPENAATVLSKLETYALVPCLNINTFMNYCTPQSLSKQYTSMLWCAGVTGVAVALAYLLAGFFEKDAYKKNIYRYALTFGNFGFMGNAVVSAIFGDEMLYCYLLFTLPLTLVCYTWGLSILVPAGGKGKSVFRRLLNPTTVSIAIGVALGLSGAAKHLPAFVCTTVANLGACMGPVAMVLTGFVVGGYSIRALLTKKQVYVATVLRLLVLPALFLGALLLLGADTTVLTLTLFAFATPLGLNTVIFPAAYGGDTSTGASMAMISHTLCVVTIPLMYALLSAVANLV